MGAYITPAKGFIFRQVIDIVDVSTAGGFAIIYDGPAYDVVWIMLEGTVTGNAVDITILNDANTPAFPETTLENVIGAFKLAHLVHGVPANVSLDYGSHSALISMTQHTGGLDGSFTGTVTQYGMRRT